MRITQAKIYLTKSVGEKDSRFGMEECDRRAGAVCTPSYVSACVARRLIGSLGSEGHSNYANRNFKTGKAAALRPRLRGARNRKSAPGLGELAIWRIEKYPLADKLSEKVNGGVSETASSLLKRLRSCVGDMF
jgi:hypothetical protein